jgi:hypothetical protein
MGFTSVGVNEYRMKHGTDENVKNSQLQSTIFNSPDFEHTVVYVITSQKAFGQACAS